ncbi:embryonic protein UVS.2-like [Hyperolius riggenbachi]|uniref:embryonic protein UVS.2-like n=1 Tax=Hyperolius riggenbachi TaxID=752182 RepID=UPI0035A2B5FE
MNCPDRNCYWPGVANGLVNIPYTLDSAYSESDRSTIVRAMMEFSSLTCIRFVPWTTERDYLSVISDDGCWSIVGRAGGAQEVSLDANGCIFNGVIQHELNHAIGFVHEHSRSDRDLYIKVLWNNIMPGYSGNFNKVNTSNMNLEYDYKSVMHYGRSSFSVDPRLHTFDTIPNPSVSVGQRVGLSSLDVAKINKLYNCNMCSSILSDTSGTFFSASNPSNYPNNYNCTWLIRLPFSPYQVQLQFLAFDVQSSSGCTADYIRVYDGPGKMSPLLLDRSCGSGQMPTLVASSELMLVEFITDGSITATGFKASYSAVQCGGTFSASSGNITSPGYYTQPEYPPFSDCLWTVLAPSGFRVQLTFQSFSVEPGPKCSYDSLEIRDGILPSSPLIGGLHCGKESIQPIASSNIGLVLHFKSDSDRGSTGFLATYSFIPSPQIRSDSRAVTPQTVLRNTIP